MHISITDDFDLAKIAQSGQCFRVKEWDDGLFRFVTGREVLYIRQQPGGRFEVSCSEETWQRVWVPYFDLQRNYAAVQKIIPDSDAYMKLAAREGRGIRILRQDPWEMLVTFIISQRKSIPAIRQAVELLAERFGEAVTTPLRNTVHLSHSRTAGGGTGRGPGRLQAGLPDALPPGRRGQSAVGTA